MKYTFTSADVAAIVAELKEKVVGLRVNQIYDIDHKTYLIKLHKPDHKAVLLLESAARIHTTEYDWPKSSAPSSFSMKLRKHLRNKRLEAINQLGVDRVVVLTFGSGELMYHLYVELYDKGNIVLTDYQNVILNVLRPRKEGEDTKIIVNQKYPLDATRSIREPPSLEKLKEVLGSAKANTPLKKILNPLLDCGTNILEDELTKIGIPIGAKIGQNVDLDSDVSKVFEATSNAQQSLMNIVPSNIKGYIIKTAEEKKKVDGTSEIVHLFQEFHFRKYAQHEKLLFDELPSFNAACDEFFSKLESNLLDKRTMQKEKEAFKKLANVKRDHEKRLKELQDKQDLDRKKGELIELNKDLVEAALKVIRSAVANQVDWKEINDLVEEAQERNDPVAEAIRSLKLKQNMMTLWLSDPYDFDENDMLLDSDEERQEGTESDKLRPTAIDIDLDLSALANARNYYNKKKQAAIKEQKTIDASVKAIKSAEKKTQQTLKEVNAIANINKARKVHWFEKFYWFISSENYLVIGGRDSQQNELVVKKHLRPNDVYVHGDIHGASSIIIKNPSGRDVPPITLNEAGVMALCYSKAWDEKIVTSAWWVWGHQVSKTAPTGEYLTTGAFMVRGKKNFLPPAYHVYGFGILFRLEESSVERHVGERKVRQQEETTNLSVLQALETLSLATEEEIEIPEDDCDPLPDISEVDEDPSPKGNIENNVDDNEESKDEEEPEKSTPEHEFPDTVVEMVHVKDGQFALKAKSAEEKNLPKQNKQHNTKRSKADSKLQEKPPKPIDEEKKLADQGQLKRGQKSKLKKMKKYKDQDEEERQLKMQLLQGAGVQKPLKGKAAKKAALEEKQRKIEVHQKQQKQKQQQQKPVIKQPKPEEEDADDEEDDQSQVADDTAILNALTAIPVSEDELLYAVPVCAPYSSMSNFKYKVKMTPGASKKGKACKTAIALFLSDKSGLVREKELLRAVKDSDLARNLPGKVKVSAPNISKVRK